MGNCESRVTLLADWKSSHKRLVTRHLELSGEVAAVVEYLRMVRGLIDWRDVHVEALKLAVHMRWHAAEGRVLAAHAYGAAWTIGSDPPVVYVEPYDQGDERQITYRGTCRGRILTLTLGPADEDMLKEEMSRSGDTAADILRDGVMALNWRQSRLDAGLDVHFSSLEWVTARRAGR
ncbi:MAG: hypothetical protein RLZZ324_173 [Candidatus Parcubacteria bacterium]|jgi:hypothetical protein